MGRPGKDLAVREMVRWRWHSDRVGLPVDDGQDTPLSIGGRLRLVGWEWLRVRRAVHAPVWMASGHIRRFIERGAR